MPTLTIRTKDYEDSTVKIDKMRMTVGRSSRNDICISDPFASRIHAEVRREGDNYLLVDLGSANSTYLNHQKMTGPIRLQSGDRFRIGETEIEFLAEDQQPVSTP